jgi:hypothetical protein
MKTKNIVRMILAKKGIISSNSKNFITKDADKVSKDEKKEITKDLLKSGFDGNGRFNTVGQAISKLHEVLEKNGFEYGQVIDGFTTSHPKGRISIDFSRKTKDPFSPIDIKNSIISFSWHLMGNESEDKNKRKYEVLAYLS